VLKFKFKTRVPKG